MASIAQLGLQPFQVQLGTGSGEQVMLYNYSLSTYQFRKYVDSISTFLGITLMVLLFIGFLVPVGKSSIVYMAFVCQIAYFSLFQFDQIPLTISGFNFLSYSNGLNQLDTQNDTHLNFPTMGLRSNLMFPNYNLSFLIFCLAPLGIGLVCLAVLKIFGNQNPPQNKVYDESSLTLKEVSIQSPTKRQLIKTMVERILFEWSFYGLLIGGNLAWISFFNFTKENCHNLGSFLFGVIFILFEVIMIIAYFKTTVRTVSLANSSSQDIENKLEISTTFGDFSSIQGQQKSIKKQTRKKIFILVIVLEKILFSALIIFVSEFTQMTSGIVILYQAALLGSLIGLYPPTVYTQKDLRVSDQRVVELESKKPKHKFWSQKTQLFFVLISIILIQVLYLSMSIMKKSPKNAQERQQLFANNVIYTRVLPIGVLMILMINMVFHSVYWIIGIKDSKLIQKATIIAKILCKYQSDTKNAIEGNQSMNIILSDGLQKEKRIISGTSSNTISTMGSISQSSLIQSNLHKRQKRRKKTSIQRQHYRQTSDISILDSNTNVPNGFNVIEIESQFEEFKPQTTLSEMTFRRRHQTTQQQHIQPKPSIRNGSKKHLIITQREKLVESPQLQIIHIQLQQGFSEMRKAQLFSELNESQNSEEKQSLQMDSREDDDKISNKSSGRILGESSGRISNPKMKEMLMKTTMAIRHS